MHAATSFSAEFHAGDELPAATSSKQTSESPSRRGLRRQMTSQGLMMGGKKRGGSPSGMRALMGLSSPTKV
jgi:hypothetical protein